MDSPFLQAVGIGILCTLVLFLSLSRMGVTASYQQRRTSGLFAGVAGFLVFLYLQDNPAVLADTNAKIVMAVIAVLLAALAAMRKSW